MSRDDSPVVATDAQALESFISNKPALARSLDEFVTKLKRREFKSSEGAATETLALLRRLVRWTNWTDPNVLIAVLRGVGRRLIRAYPLELVVGNCVRRVLFQIREEASLGATANCPNENEDACADGDAGELQEALDDVTAITTTSSSGISKLDLKSSATEGIDEIKSELEIMYDSISMQSSEHIHANETVMVFGYSKSVEHFLISAHKKRSFKVIVAEAAPEYEGHEMAKRLAKENISTTVIVDNAAFALMARVNKVLVGTHAVMANGGIVAQAGTQMLALAAKHHSVPVVCITGLYKLCPIYPHNPDTFNDLRSPGSVLEYTDLPHYNSVQVLSPVFDIVPPELVSLFVTNSGGHQPSYVYRLLAEHYSPQDALTEGCAHFN